MGSRRNICYGAILTIILPGLGHYYIGKPRRALLVFGISLIVSAPTDKILPATSIAPWNIILPIALAALFLVAVLRDLVIQSRSAGRAWLHDKWYFHLPLILASFAITSMVPLDYETLRVKDPCMQNTLHNGIVLVNRCLYRAQDPGLKDIVSIPGPPLSVAYKNRKTLKRCVALPGQTVEFRNGDLFVNGRFVPPPPSSLQKNAADTNPCMGDQILDFAPIRVPRKGDTLRIPSMGLREFAFAWSLVAQESPDEKVETNLQLFLEGKRLGTNRKPEPSAADMEIYEPIFKRPPPFSIQDRPWYELENMAEEIEKRNPQLTFEIEKYLYLNGKAIDQYVVRDDYYFVMRDNRCAYGSEDSRNFGFVGRRSILGRAEVTCISWDSLIPSPRWGEIGRAIH